MPKSRRTLKTTLAVVFFMASIGVTTSVHSPSMASADERNAVADSAPSTSPCPTHAVKLPRVNLNDTGLIETDSRTQMAVSYSPVGVGYSSQASQRPLPALSLIKLYIGQYVLDNGTADDVKQVEKMISRSDDDLAADFYRKYPLSVDSIATEYGLYNTSGGEKWGVSKTTAEDVVAFVSQLRLKHPNSEVLEAMRHWSPVAADGYRQNFGLAGLSGSEGAKMGWSNQRTWHSSVVFGPGYVMAAITEGGKYDHTEDVAEGIVGVDYRDLMKSAKSAGKKTNQKTGQKVARETPKARAVRTGH
ncbi:hypothetical protein [uncultured Corynebacterium sp.]|uniref:hypothetical protein n=1 Tax=uncultured Corynebacterium sp. TaxID=159447 RepID=UPI00260CDA91|nr:hypothetical protein [uncultured Corynebacterium sp.]